jgi:hypothetical protein
MDRRDSDFVAVLGRGQPGAAADQRERVWIERRAGFCRILRYSMASIRIPKTVVVRLRFRVVHGFLFVCAPCGRYAVPNSTVRLTIKRKGIDACVVYG